MSNECKRQHHTARPLTNGIVRYLGTDVRAWLVCGHHHYYCVPSIQGHLLKLYLQRMSLFLRGDLYVALSLHLRPMRMRKGQCGSDIQNDTHLVSVYGIRYVNRSVAATHAREYHTNAFYMRTIVDINARGMQFAYQLWPHCIVRGNRILPSAIVSE